MESRSAGEEEGMWSGSRQGYAGKFIFTFNIPHVLAWPAINLNLPTVEGMGQFVPHDKVAL